MTQAEIQRLIELGILTPECESTFRKLSPERKREARRQMKERERMSGLLLARILQRLKTA